METAKRIVVNTFAQHVRSIVNIGLSLYSTRLILEALGQSDLGIYMLVAGVVSMLGFLTNALVVTTQRQLSFQYGHGELSDVRRMFSNSLLLHIVLGVVLGGTLSAIEPLLFNGFLKIEPSRIAAASTVYYIVILSLLITFLTAPYRALFIARENIVYISIIDIFDGVIKLLAAFWLLYYPDNRLVAYAWMITGIMAFNYIALLGWAITHFKEALVFPRYTDINKAAMKELTGFAGWTVYSLGCIIGRTQGVAIILNQFFGTIINAAYGIAQQIFGAIQFIAQSVLNAMSPQLIKAEGAGNRQRMLLLAMLSSKYAFLLLGLVTIPVVFEMPAILHVWLKEIPDHTVLLCRFILITALFDQLTIGLATANQAIGRIRNYSITVNTIKVLTLPAFWLILSLSHSVEWAMWCYLVFELLCAIVRLPFLKITAGLSVSDFIRRVFVRSFPPVIIQTACCWTIINTIEIPFRLLFTATISVVAGVIAIWFWAMEPMEHDLVTNIIKRNHER